MGSERWRVVNLVAGILVAVPSFLIATYAWAMTLSPMIPAGQTLPLNQYWPVIASSSSAIAAIGGLVAHSLDRYRSGWLILALAYLPLIALFVWR